MITSKTGSKWILPISIIPLLGMIFINSLLLVSEFNKAGLKFQPAQMLDTRFAYSIEEGYQNLKSLGVTGRFIIGKIAYSIDMIIPMMLAFVLFLTIKQLFIKVFKQKRFPLPLFLSFPWIAALFNIMENTSIRILLRSFDYSYAIRILPFTRVFTGIKSAFMVLTLLIIIILVIDCFRYRNKQVH